MFLSNPARRVIAVVLASLLAATFLVAVWASVAQLPMGNILDAGNPLLRIFPASRGEEDATNFASTDATAPETSEDRTAAQYAGDASVDPAVAPVPATTPEPAPISTPDTAPAPAPGGGTVGCGILYNDPDATCALDANGFITLPDGSTAPVLVRPDETAYIQDASGGLTLIGQGASFITGEDTIQDAAQEQPPAAEPVEPVAEPVEPVL